MYGFQQEVIFHYLAFFKRKRSLSLNSDKLLFHITLAFRIAEYLCQQLPILYSQDGWYP